jgi:hypothetical protein
MSGDPRPSSGCSISSCGATPSARNSTRSRPPSQVPALGPDPFRAVFIRAPLIERLGPGVTPLATLEDGTIVAAERDNILATSFHPELTGDPRFHEYFLAKVAAARATAPEREALPRP